MLYFGRFPYILLFCVTSFFPACKSKRDPIAETPNHYALYCEKKTDLPFCSRNITEEQGQCQSTAGAVWDETRLVCQRPQALGDCQKISPKLVWDGIACVGANVPPNFYRLCISSQITEAISHSIEVLSREFKGSSCQSIYSELFKLSSMVYQGE